MIYLNELDKTQKELIEKAVRKSGIKSSYEMPIIHSPEDITEESIPCNLYQTITDYLEKTKNPC